MRIKFWVIQMRSAMNTLDSIAQKQKTTKKENPLKINMKTLSIINIVVNPNQIFNTYFHKNKYRHVINTLNHPRLLQIIMIRVISN